jgi:hypothetical protein
MKFNFFITIIKVASYEELNSKLLDGRLLKEGF